MKQHEELIERAMEIIRDGDANGEGAKWQTAIGVRNVIEQLVTALEAQPSTIHHNKPDHANSDLVDLLVKYMKGDELDQLSFLQCESIINALEYREFNVLQHLRDGGNIFSDTQSPDTVYYYLQKSAIWEFTKDGMCYRTNSEVLWRIKNWQPYTPPPVHGSREWAMEQDFKVCHVAMDNPGTWVDFSNNSNSMLLDNKTAWDNPMFVVGWSRFIEPRSPGWYSAKIRTTSQSIPQWWNGKFWLVGEDEKKASDANFHWIGSTRIELESPEES